MHQKILTKQAISNFIRSDTTAAIKDICQPLSKLGINGVFYSRFVDRMRVNLISNQTIWLQHLHDHMQGYKEYFESQFHFRTGFSIDFLNTFVYSKMVADMACMDMNHAIYLSYSSADSRESEVFVFTTSMQSNIGNQQLIEKLNSLNSFCLSFKEKADPIIKKAQVKNTLLKNSSEPLITKRETDIIYYLILGMSQKQIAWELNISPKTVEKYMNKVKDKLQCNSRYDLVKKSFQVPSIRVRLLNALAQNIS